ITNWKKNGWKRRRGTRLFPIKNEGLWRRLDKLVSQHSVAFHWLPAHAGHPENERCDELARQAIPPRDKNQPARVYITHHIFPDEIDRLRAAGHRIELREGHGPIPPEVLLKKVRDVEALICLLPDRIDRKVITAGTELRIIANIAVGYENIDVAAAKEAGIVVTNTPGVLTETTADLTLALIMATARRIPEADAYVRDGQFQGWELIQPQLGLEINGKTLGVVGMGRIGTAVARRGRLGFAMDVLYHDHHRNAAAETELGAKVVPFERLLAESDFVCIHTPLTPETHHMFNREAFRRMKRSAILINAARGAVVDESALVWALETGQIAGAGIDVYEQEPKIHPGLISLRERVVLTPHLGSATSATRRAMTRIAIDNTLEVLAGREPLNPISII
ncbi:MAG: NAD(P)-dependent oxidoreductase, partial [Candidatus Bipolaricaulota bacterium]|nr:NAD(P)-dependent oxidoreductase [Candidatus Bipolaricaulota bacterium]